MRLDGRNIDETRKIELIRNYIKYPEGSVLIEMGNTKVLCNASVEETVPAFKKLSGEGWVSAEYSMLPRATQTRNTRDIHKLKQNQRSVEIQRLIGRSLRGAVSLPLLDGFSVTIDCDVLQADGGTRTAAITGGFVALYDACTYIAKKTGRNHAITNFITAISVGIVDGIAMLDLCYEEDKNANSDMNIVMCNAKDYIEVQGTAENGTFSYDELLNLLNLAKIGNEKLLIKQKQALLLN